MVGSRCPRSGSKIDRMVQRDAQGRLPDDVGVRQAAEVDEGVAELGPIRS